MSERWEVTRTYPASLPGYGPSVTFELTEGTIIADQKLRDFGRADDLAAWVNRDAPGTLKPTSKPVTGEPRQIIPAGRLQGVARRRASRTK